MVQKWVRPIKNGVNEKDTKFIRDCYARCDWRIRERENYAYPYPVRVGHVVALAQFWGPLQILTSQDI